MTSSSRSNRKRKPAKNPLKINNKEWDIERVVDIVCDKLATTSDSLRTVMCSKVEIDGKEWDLPNVATFMRWLQRDDEIVRDDDSNSICEQYARARRLQTEAMHDDLLESRKAALSPVIDRDGQTVYDENGNVMMAVTRDGIALARLEADNKKWIMARMQPKKYGDKIQADHTHNAGKSLQDLLIEVAKNG